MNAIVSITAALDADTIAMVEEIARARGITGAQFAADAIRRAALEEADYRAWLQEGIDAADRGDTITQEEIENWIEDRIAVRRSA